MCPCSIHSCCYIWLYKGQRWWAVIYGGCNHLCDKEEWWRLVWRSLQSSNWLVSWELRWINHALCRLKSFAFPSWVLYSVIPWLFTRVTKANRIVLIYFQIKNVPISSGHTVCFNGMIECPSLLSLWRQYVLPDGNL